MRRPIWWPPPSGSRADVANRLYVTNRISGTVSVINTLTNTVIDTNPATTTIDSITVGSQPESITINADRDSGLCRELRQ